MRYYVFIVLELCSRKLKYIRQLMLYQLCYRTLNSAVACVSDLFSYLHHDKSF